MAEVHKSFRLDSELLDAATRLAESRGQSFTALVVFLLGEAVERRGPAPAPDVDRFRDELTKLAEVVRVERLTHSEIAESLIALSRHCRELELERQRTKAVASEAIEGLEKGKTQLKSMVELGGFVSEKCRGVVAGMEASLARVESLSGTTAMKMDENLRRIGEVSERMTLAGRAQIEGFEKQMLQSMESFRTLVQTFQAETKAQAHDFLLKLARQWQWILGAIVVCLLVGGGATFVAQYFNSKGKIEALQSEKKLYMSMYQEEKATAESRQQQVFYFLRETCDGRQVTVHKRYCAIPGLNALRYPNPFK